MQETSRQLNDFDEDQQLKLGILAKLNAYLHFPFFANTFSLPFHYANLINSNQDLSKWENSNQRKRLIEHNWEDPIPSGLDQHANDYNVFYSTKAALLDFVSSPLNSGRSNMWDIFPVEFTRYKPLFLFADFRAYTESVRKSKLHSIHFLEDLLNAVRNQGVSEVELQTDIPNQAGHLVNHLRNGGFWTSVSVIRDPIDALIAIRPEQRVLRLYFYGAPTTSKMLDDDAHFLSIKFPEILAVNDNSTITQVCLAMPKGRNEHDFHREDALKAEFEVAMLEYHKRVFEVARDDKLALINVWSAYNRYAQRKQHAATFSDLKEFAKCISSHHNEVLEWQSERGNITSI